MSSRQVRTLIASLATFEIHRCTQRLISLEICDFWFILKSINLPCLGPCTWGETTKDKPIWHSHDTASDLDATMDEFTVDAFVNRDDPIPVISFDAAEDLSDEVDDVSDVDGDGYGNSYVAATSSCSPVSGMVQDDSDCNDADSTIHPGAEEVCDALDNDCDGSIDEGLGSTSCGVGECAVTTANCIGEVVQVCTPTLPTAEACDGLDNNCNGTTDENCVNHSGCHAQRAKQPGAGFLMLMLLMLALIKSPSILRPSLTPILCAKQRSDLAPSVS